MTPDINRILVAVDFSTNSDRALDYAGMLARRFGASLHLLHVVEPMSLGSPSIDASAFATPGWNKLLAEDAHRELTSLGAPFQPYVATTSVLYGDPSSCILRDADDRQMDLIVMGTHGRGALAQLMMGSVAERVVRIASCPVLTVRHPEHEFVTPDALVAASRA